MAKIFPFQPYRYTDRGGPLETLATQPYDKISPEMRTRYLASNPHNLVRIILGEPLPSDTAVDNVYTRATGHLKDWIASGVLARDAEPAVFAYYQEFCVPETNEKKVRKGFIGLGAVEDYSEGTVYRHEQTLSGPKKDRLELLRHTHAHCGQLFMLYPDPEFAVERLLDEAAQGEPAMAMTDEYGVQHRVWKIADPARIAAIQQVMSDKKLLIADGHHRYETALAFRNENPDLAGAGRVMMTFVNMHSPGLAILATHRLVRNLADFRLDSFLRNAGKSFGVRRLSSAGELRQVWTRKRPASIRIGLCAAGSDDIYLLEADRGEGELDVQALHEKLLGEALGIGEEAVRNEQNLKYARGLDNALKEVKAGEAQLAFLLEPVTVDEVARIAFSGGVMPQKSTDFYPKLLSGLTIYKLD